METYAWRTVTRKWNIFSVKNPCRISTRSFMTHYKPKTAFLLTSQNKVHVAWELPLGKKKQKQKRRRRTKKTKNPESIFQGHSTWNLAQNCWLGWVGGEQSLLLVEMLNKTNVK